MPREPDGVKWLRANHFAIPTSDYEGGKPNGGSIFNKDATLVSNPAESGTCVVRIGHYPEHRSRSRGAERSRSRLPGLASEHWGSSPQSAARSSGLRSDRPVRAGAEQLFAVRCRRTHGWRSRTAICSSAAKRGRFHRGRASASHVMIYEFGGRQPTDDSPSCWTESLLAEGALFGFAGPIPAEGGQLLCCVGQRLLRAMPDDIYHRRHETRHTYQWLAGDVRWRVMSAKAGP